MMKVARDVKVEQLDPHKRRKRRKPGRAPQTFEHERLVLWPP